MTVSPVDAAAHCNEVLFAAGVPAMAMPIDDGHVAVFSVAGDLDQIRILPLTHPHLYTHGYACLPDDAMWIAHRVAELHQGAPTWTTIDW